ncbi:MAG TPA: hypothetical protein VIU62_15200 [Chloroflexota bacterium]
MQRDPLVQDGGAIPIPSPCRQPAAEVVIGVVVPSRGMAGPSGLATAEAQNRSPLALPKTGAGGATRHSTTRSDQQDNGARLSALAADGDLRTAVPFTAVPPARAVERDVACISSGITADVIAEMTGYRLAETSMSVSGGGT